MRLSKRCEYGLKAAVRLAHRHGNGFLQSREIADSEELPAKFLESILLALRSASILESKVGAGGGYRLSRPPEQVAIRELIEALETTGESSPVADPPNPAQTTGGAAMDLLNQRLDDAIEEAVGSLTLASLVSMAEKTAAERGSAMYYI